MVPGAPILTGRAALRVGAGRIRLAVGRAGAVALGLSVPEAGIIRVVSTHDGDFLASAAWTLARAAADCDASVIGPGMSDARVAGILTRALLQATAAGAVVDAAALPAVRSAEAFARLGRGRTVLTPHAGEMAEMMDAPKAEVLANPPAFAREAAARFQSVVVLKGAISHVATPDGRCWQHEGGVFGLATSGSGDVLAGVIAGLMARGAAPERAAIWGVHLHAGAGAQRDGAQRPRHHDLLAHRQVSDEGGADPRAAVAQLGRLVLLGRGGQPRQGAAQYAGRGCAHALQRMPPRGASGLSESR